MLEKKLSASTVNVRLSAVRKLIGEAQHNGIIGACRMIGQGERPEDMAIVYRCRACLTVHGRR